MREAEISDAESLSHLIQDVEASSDFMLWEAGEREIENERQKKMIERTKASNNSIILVAESQSHELIGYILAIGGDAKRNSHSAYMVVGISENRRGQGVGSKLLRELEQWAVHHGLHRLELTVVTRNEAGLSLYQKMGFKIEGTKRDSLFIHNGYVDEYYMAKLL